jgi:hypothetical protein
LAVKGAHLKHVPGAAGEKAKHTVLSRDGRASGDDPVPPQFLEKRKEGIIVGCSP